MFRADVFPECQLADINKDFLAQNTTPLIVNSVVRDSFHWFVSTFRLRFQTSTLNHTD